MFVPADITNIQTGNDDGNFDNYVIPTAAYTQDTLYLAWITSRPVSGSAVAPALLSPGLPWTQIAVIADPGNDVVTSCWRSVPSSNVNTTITANYSSIVQDWFGYSIVEVDNADVTDSGANAIAQFQTFTENAVNHSYSLNSNPSVENLVISGWGKNANSTVFTPGSDETEIAQSFRIFSQYNLVADGTVDCSTNLGTQVASIALEVNFSIRTIPDQFTFTDVNDAELNTVYTDSQSITGPTAGQTLNVTNGEVSNNNGSTWSDTSTTMVTGQTLVRATVTSSNQFETAVSQTPVVNTTSDTFTVTTGANPRQFTTNHFLTAPLFQS